jgi:hypothetical protein
VTNKKNIRKIIKDKELGVTEKYILYFVCGWTGRRDSNNETF